MKCSYTKTTLYPLKHTQKNKLYPKCLYNKLKVSGVVHPLYVQKKHFINDNYEVASFGHWVYNLTVFEDLGMKIPPLDLSIL